MLLDNNLGFGLARPVAVDQQGHRRVEDRRADVAQADAPAKALAQAAGAVSEFFIVADGASGLFGQLFAFKRQRHVALIAGKQRNAQRLFKHFNMLAQRRLSDVQPRGGPSKMQLFRQDRKRAQVSIFHGKLSLVQP